MKEMLENNCDNENNLIASDEFKILFKDNYNYLLENMLKIESTLPKLENIDSSIYPHEYMESIHDYIKSINISKQRIKNCLIIYKEIINKFN